MTYVWLHDVARLRAQEVFRVSPFVGTTQVYDSNLFSASVARQTDFITRVSPGIEGEYRSALLSFLGRYAFDLEWSADHPQLSTAQARQQASVDLRYNRWRRLTLAVDGAFTKTETPGELNATTGLTLARARAERVEVHPAIVRQLDPVTVGTIDYTWTDERLAGGIATRAHRAAIHVDRHISRRDVVAVDYGVRTFLFANDDPLTSHAFGIGWSRQITRQAVIELRGGPVLTGSTPAPEVLASIRYRLRPGELSVVYARTQTTVVGLAGVVDTQSVTASATYSVKPQLQFRIVPGVFRTTRDGLRADAGRLALEAERPITRRLSLRATYEATQQRGRLSPAVSASPISRHVVQISVVAAPVARGLRGH